MWMYMSAYVWIWKCLYMDVISMCLDVFAYVYVDVDVDVDVDVYVYVYVYVWMCMCMCMDGDVSLMNEDARESAGSYKSILDPN
ncbi:hypothetical protein Hdeb2414_s0004g00149611 [Helianthus debilis subsp. tardiflorus]